MCLLTNRNEHSRHKIQKEGKLLLHFAIGHAGSEIRNELFNQYAKWCVVEDELSTSSSPQNMVEAGWMCWDARIQKKIARSFSKPRKNGEDLRPRQRFPHDPKLPATTTMDRVWSKQIHVLEWLGKKSRHESNSGSVAWLNDVFSKRLSSEAHWKHELFWKEERKEKKNQSLAMKRW